MTDKHHQHLTEMIAETKAEIEKIIEQEKSARKVLELIEQKSPKLQNKIKYLLSAKQAYEEVMGGAINVAESEIAEPVEPPQKKSLFKRRKKPEPEPTPESAPEPASENLEDAIKDL